MHIDASGLFNIILVGLTIAGVLAGAVATVRSRIVERTIQTLSENNEAITAQNEIFRQQIESLQTDGHRKDEKIEKQQGEIETLSRVVTGTDAIEKLTAALTSGFLQQSEQHDSMLKVLERIAVKIG